MPRLLLAEDDTGLGPALKRALNLEGHVVDLVVQGEDVLGALAGSSYDLVLLDIGLPGMGGLDALKEMRRHGDMTPVIIVTAFDRTAQRVAGLDAGADDYVVKPIDIEELAARIRSHLRRRESRVIDYLEVGAVRLDLPGRTVTLSGTAVRVTPKEFRVLALLMRRARRFVPKSDIERELYDLDTWVESNTVEVAISALRRKLGRDFIRTARGLGYMVGGREG